MAKSQAASRKFLLEARKYVAIKYSELLKSG
jgi:hypothetical protein